jgi:hypothetical protein
LLVARFYARDQDQNRSCRRQYAACRNEAGTSGTLKQLMRGESVAPTFCTNGEMILYAITLLERKAPVEIERHLGVTQMIRTARGISHRASSLPSSALTSN